MDSMTKIQLIRGALAAVLAPCIAMAQDPPEELRDTRESAITLTSGMGEVFAMLMNLRSATAQSLTVRDVQGHKVVQVLLGEEVRTLELHAFSMRSDQCRFYVQDERGLVEVDPPPVATYRGDVKEDPGAVVTASIVDGQLKAVIVDSNDEFWVIEPADKAMPGVPPDWHVVYRASDDLTESGICGVVGGAAPLPIPEPNGGVNADASPVSGGAGQGRTEIGFDADFEFFQANGSSVADTIADIESVMNTVGYIYQGQIPGQPPGGLFDDPICYEITGFIVRTVEPDPYISTDPDTMLCEFTNEWNANVPDSPAGIPRDVAHLFTGKNMNGTTIGIAWPGVVCDFIFGNCNGGRLHYGISQLITNAINRVQLTAHELGHNWSACHCNQMACTGGGADSDCGVMNSFINGSLAFGNRAITAIVGYRNNTANCLTDCENPLFVDAAGPDPSCDGLEDGSALCPYHTVSQAVAEFHWVGGTLSVAGGNYPESLTIQKVMTMVKTPESPGSVVIGQ